MKHTIQKEIFLKIYENCVRSRYLEQSLWELWYQHQIRTLYSGLGSEMASSIIVALLEKNDYLIPRYRGYAAALSKGIPVEWIIAEMLGKKTGTSKGIGDVSSFHDRDCSVSGYTINLGAMFPAAIGLALSIIFKKENRIVVHFFGDGEASRTLFASALHLASLWRLPILFVCENNRISDKTVLEDTSPTATIAQRAKGYDIEAASISDTDPVAIFTRASEMIAACRQNKRPFLLEIMQKRFMPHSSFEETRSAAEEKIFPDQGPLNTWVKFITQNGILNKELISREKSAEEEVRAAIQKIQKEKELSQEEFFSIFYE